MLEPFYSFFMQFNVFSCQVAGVPVAHWSGNKSGIGYNRDNPDIVVGGRNSVDLPSDARGLRRGIGRSKIPNRGRGLLPTPLFSPWPVDYDGKSLTFVRSSVDWDNRLVSIGRRRLGKIDIQASWWTVI